MKAYAIVWGSGNGAVTLTLSSGNKSLAIFHEYSDAVRTLAGFEKVEDYKIIEVRITA